MKKFEQYQDMIARIYPELVKEDESGSIIKTLSRTVTFQVTDKCNLACTYCYQINKGERKMKFEDAKKLIDMLLEGDERLGGYVTVENSPAIILEFIGGEPFLQIELIEQICDYFYDRAIELCHQWATMFCISICSNGVLYFDENVQRFLNKYKNNMSFSVTIDGNKELHDSCRVFPNGNPSYDLAVAAANDWMSRGYYMGSKITIAPGNLDYLYDAIVHMVELGYTEINANTVYEKGWTIDHAKQYYCELKRISDYWIDNDLVDTHFLSLFKDDFFCPKDEKDDENWCFKAGTMILTPTGNVPIEELKVGDSVISGDGSIQKIINIKTHIDESPVRLKAVGVLETFTTETHPYLTKPFSHRGNKSVNRYNDIGYISVKDLKKKDKIALYKHKFGTKHVDRRLAYIVGRYIGDGWYSKTTGYKLCCSFDEFYELMDAIDDAGLVYSYTKYKTVMQFNIFKRENPELIDIISDAGHVSAHKKIPGEVFSWDESSVKALLHGLFDADGYYNESSIKFNTISSNLANDVMILLRGLSLYPTCSISRRAGLSVIEGRQVTIHDRYNVGVYYDNTRSCSCSYDENTDVIWTSFRSNDHIDEPYEVYNLTVDNTHTYIANGAIVHNCGTNFAMLAMDPDGYLYSCIRFMESSLGTDQPPMKLGHVDIGIGQTECDKNCVSCLNSITRRSQSTDECFYCPIAAGCSWCTAYNYQETGTPDKRVTYSCDMHKARALANVYFWNRYYISKNIEKRFKMYCPEDWALEIIDEDEYNLLKRLEKEDIENED